MFFVLNDFSQDLVLLVCLLYRVEYYPPVDGSEIWPVILGQSIVPVLEPFTQPAWPIISRIPSPFLGKGVVELVLGSEATVEFVFEVVHE